MTNNDQGDWSDRLLPSGRADGLAPAAKCIQQEPRNVKNGPDSSLKSRFEELCKRHLMAAVEARGAAIKDLGHFYVRIESGGLGSQARVAVTPIWSRESELTFTFNGGDEVRAVINFYPKALGSRQDSTRIHDLSYQYFDEKVRTLFKIALGG